MRRDRKIFSTVLLVSAAACITMSVLHIEFKPASVANLVIRGGTNVVDPLVASIKRRTSW